MHSLIFERMTLENFNKRRLYWVSQFTGWSLYIAIAGIFYWSTSGPLGIRIIFGFLTAWLIGMSLSHLYREVIIRLGWMRLGIFQLMPRVMLAIIILGVVFQLIYGSITGLVLTGTFSTNWGESFANAVGWAMMLFMWSLIYFLFHFFENYRKEEIKNLTWEANKNEFELNKLKSQLNPHFIFNSMNSIRALVDEEPQKAKKSITQLANILRNTLLMGKKKVIPFEEEMNLVRDYLEIETSRFEERLEVRWNLHPESSRFKVPPMMIQTLVENGIKHGISHLPEGGFIEVNTSVQSDKLYLVIRNSGQFTPTRNGSGFGLINTRQRMQLLYGHNGTFNIYNLSPDVVTTEVSIPIDLNPQ